MSAPLPQLWGVLYAGPNQNGERKACSNCMFFSQGNPAAALMGAMGSNCQVLPVSVTPDQVCGYHIPAGEKADPELAGLERVPGGTSCDTCRYYEPDSATSGHCEAVDGEDGGPAIVEAMGCCGRWEAGEGDDVDSDEDGMGY